MKVCNSVNHRADKLIVWTCVISIPTGCCFGSVRLENVKEQPWNAAHVVKLISHSTTASTAVRNKLDDWSILFQSSLASVVPFLHNRCQHVVHCSLQWQLLLPESYYALNKATYKLFFNNSGTKTTQRQGSHTTQRVGCGAEIPFV